MEFEYALNTFYLLITAALVMWMAAGFTMLEAGLVRRKILLKFVTKNIGLYSIACFMFMVMWLYGPCIQGCFLQVDFSFGHENQVLGILLQHRMMEHLMLRIFRFLFPGCFCCNSMFNRFWSSC